MYNLQSKTIFILKLQNNTCVCCMAARGIGRGKCSLFTVLTLWRSFCMSSRTCPVYSGMTPTAMSLFCTLQPNGHIMNYNYCCMIYHLMGREKPFFKFVHGYYRSQHVQAWVGRHSVLDLDHGEKIHTFIWFIRIILSVPRCTPLPSEPDRISAASESTVCQMQRIAYKNLRDSGLLQIDNLKARKRV